MDKFFDLMHRLRYRNNKTPSNYGTIGCGAHNCEICNPSKAYQVREVKKLDQYGDRKISYWQVLDGFRLVIFESHSRIEAEKFAENMRK